MDVSVIIPMKNIAENIESIMDAIVKQNSNIKIEIVAVDMGSEDNTMITALEALKKYVSSGCVIQCGDDSIGAALNAGIKKASGKFVTFIFPRHLYTSFIEDYYNLAIKNNADFIFGTAKGCKNTFPKKSIDRLFLIKDVIYGDIPIDIASILISMDLIRSKSVYFSQSLQSGYSEEFIYKALINSDNVFISSHVMKKNRAYQAPKQAKTANKSEFFDKLKAMIEIKENVITSNSELVELEKIFEGERIPSALISCIDSLFDENYSVKAIKTVLKKKKYDKLLSVNKYTDKKLKRRIYIWKLTPWLYRSKG